MKVRTTHPQHGRLRITQLGWAVIVIAVCVVVLVVATVLIFSTPIDLGGAG